MKVLNPPRPGKKLLVLDIDYTLFDHRTPAENPLQLMRPCEPSPSLGVCAVSGAMLTRQKWVGAWPCRSSS